jgi:hypothetical protein
LKSAPDLRELLLSAKDASYRFAGRLACVFTRAIPDGYSRKVAKG